MEGRTGPWASSFTASVTVGKSPSHSLTPKKANNRPVPLGPQRDYIPEANGQGTKMRKPPSKVASTCLIPSAETGETQAGGLGVRRTRGSYYPEPRLATCPKWDY